MPAKKQVARIPEADPPPYQCGQCWFYEPIAIDHGACYATPPTVLYDDEGDLTCPRTIVLAEDRGCVHWKPRHSA